MTDEIWGRAEAKLSDFRVGDAVVYRADGLRDDLRCEDGVVSSVGEQYVFVRFTGQHPDAPGKACRPQDLFKA